MQNYTLYTHRRTFSLSRTYSYKKITKYKQFFLLAIRAQQKIAKFLAQTYLIDIQPSSCSLLNGFPASNQTLQQQIETKQKDRIHQPERRVPEREPVGNRMCQRTLNETWNASRRCLICSRNSLFLQTTRL